MLLFEEPFSLPPTVHTLQAIDLRGLDFADTPDTAEAEAETSSIEIEICRDGKWAHPYYGEIVIDPGVRQAFERNFRLNVRQTGDLPLDYDHELGPAPGWITDLRNEESALIATVALTDNGRQAIRSGDYRYFSPEWHPDWTDTARGEQRYGPTLFGGALTNRPFFRELRALHAHEDTTITTPPTPQENPVADPAIQAADPALSQRLSELEAEVASYRAREERGVLVQAFADARWGDGGRLSLAPATRTALTDALMQVPPEPRQAILAALRAAQFVELGTRGFVSAETSGVTLSETEEQIVADMATRQGQNLDEVRQQFIAVRQAREARKAGGNR